MKLYYMELKEDGFDIHVVEDYERHKIWAKYPKAKEITKEMYLALTKATHEHNKKVKGNEHKAKDTLSIRLSKLWQKLFVRERQ